MDIGETQREGTIEPLYYPISTPETTPLPSEEPDPVPVPG
jgi:hypothetical protein